MQRNAARSMSFRSQNSLTLSADDKKSSSTSSKSGSKSSGTVSKSGVSASASSSKPNTLENRQSQEVDTEVQALVQQKTAAMENQMKFIYAESLRMLQAISLAKQVLKERRGIESKSDAFVYADLQEKRLKTAAREQEALRKKLLTDKALINFNYNMIYGDKEKITPKAALANKKLMPLVEKIDKAPFVLYVPLSDEAAAFRQKIGDEKFKELLTSREALRSHFEKHNENGMGISGSPTSGEIYVEAERKKSIEAIEAESIHKVEADVSPILKDIEVAEISMQDVSDDGALPGGDAEFRQIFRGGRF